jgi:hypothetical protein
MIGDRGYAKLRAQVQKAAKWPLYGNVLSLPIEDEKLPGAQDSGLSSEVLLPSVSF